MISQAPKSHHVFLQEQIPRLIVFTMLCIFFIRCYINCCPGPLLLIRYAFMVFGSFSFSFPRKRFSFCSYCVVRLWWIIWLCGFYVKKIDFKNFTLMIPHGRRKMFRYDPDLCYKIFCNGKLEILFIILMFCSYAKTCRLNNSFMDVSPWILLLFSFSVQW